VAIVSPIERDQEIATGKVLNPAEAADEIDRRAVALDQLGQRNARELPRLTPSPTLSGPLKSTTGLGPRKAESHSRLPKFPSLRNLGLSMEKGAHARVMDNRPRRELKRSWRELVPLEMSLSPRLRHLLVVAGPSGAGKSTFIDCLKHGAIPKEVEMRLPDGARRWPVLARRQHQDWALLAAGREAVDIIFHVDTAALVVYPDHTVDARALLRRAEQISVVEIVGEPNRIVSQHVNRSWKKRSRRTSDQTLTLATIESAQRDSSLPDDQVASLFVRAGFLPRAVFKLMLYRRAG
jgi:hypothetical protein